MRARSLLAIACVVSSTAGLCLNATQIAQAGTGVVVKTAYFNHPLPPFGDPVPPQTQQVGAPSDITAAILNLLDQAANTATVRIAMFEATLQDDAIKVDSTTTEQVGDATLIEQQIVRSLTKGVKVMVVADYHKDHDFWNRVASDAAAAGVASRFTVSYCHNSCYASGAGIMHDKFMIIDNLVLTGTATSDVVFQSSANWRTRQLNTHYWNNAVEIDNDAGLYDGYKAYFTDLQTCAASGSCTGYPPSPVQFWAGTNGDQVNVLPQGGNDPVLAALGNIQHCALLDPLNAHTTIDVAVNSWPDTGRGLDILVKLRQLDAGGCPVRIVLPARVSAATELRGTDTLSLKAHCTGGGLPSATEHNKYVLINGLFGTSTIAQMDVPAAGQVVFTGSHRFNPNSLLTADEVWMRIANLTPGAPNPQSADIYAQYEAEFNQMWNETPLCRETSGPTVDTDDDDLDP